jgi:hypothetical protein
MANNRLWLVHRPTGAAVRLGKRLADGWYGPPSVEQMNAFFEAAGEGPSQDDFVLALEDADGAPMCSEDWKYEGDIDVPGSIRPAGAFTLKGDKP